jgi:hypothetical protein
MFKDENKECSDVSKYVFMVLCRSRPDKSNSLCAAEVIFDLFNQFSTEALKVWGQCYKILISFFILRFQMKLPNVRHAFTQILTSFIETRCSSLLIFVSSTAIVRGGSTILTCIREVFGSNLCWSTDYLDWGFSWIFSKLPIGFMVSASI